MKDIQMDPLKLACLELATKTFGTLLEPKGLVKAAEGFYKFVSVESPPSDTVVVPLHPVVN